MHRSCKWYGSYTIVNGRSWTCRCSSLGTYADVWDWRDEATRCNDCVPTLLMKKTEEWRIAAAINGDTVKTIARRSNIILCRRETTLFPSYGMCSQKVFRRTPFYFILFLPLLFPVEVSMNFVGQRRGSNLSFILFLPPPSPLAYVDLYL